VCLAKAADSFGNYTHAALQLFNDIKGEYTLGQASEYALTHNCRQCCVFLIIFLDSIGYPFSLSREKFSHPVFIITGDRDAPFCAGNCSANSADPGVTQLDGGRKLFPSVKSQNFDTHVIPDTGHGINFRQSIHWRRSRTAKLTTLDNTAALSYRKILEFVTAHSE